MKILNCAKLSRNNSMNDFTLLREPIYNLKIKPDLKASMTYLFPQLLPE